MHSNIGLLGVALAPTNPKVKANRPPWLWIFFFDWVLYSLLRCTKCNRFLFISQLAKNVRPTYSNLLFLYMYFFDFDRVSCQSGRFGPCKLRSTLLSIYERGGYNFIEYLTVKFDVLSVIDDLSKTEVNTMTAQNRTNNSKTPENRCGAYI